MTINITNLETVLSAKIVAATIASADQDLLLISKSVEALDNSIGLKAADIGTTVQAYDSTIVVDADIGSTVQAYDSTIVVDADIGTTVQAYDSTIVVDADIGSTVQAYDADTSKLDVAEIRTANIDLLTYTEKYITIGMNGIVDLSLGTVFTHDHSHATSGNMTAFTLSNVPSTGTSGFILILENGGAYPLTWWTGSGSAAIKWPAATPPTLTAAGTDIFTFTTPDSGVTWYGIPAGIGMA
jgi:hypothetical protein